MGSGPSSNRPNTRRQTTPKVVLVRDQTSTSQDDHDEDATIEDKIKLQPMKDYTEEPNPITTDALQRKLNMKSVVKRVLIKNALKEHYILARTSGKAEDLERIDAHAVKAPKEVLDTFEHLVEYFDEPLLDRNDRAQMLVRSFLVWIGSQQAENSETDRADNVVLEEASGKSPSFLLGLLKANFTTCLTVFTLLCWSAGIKCRKISGLSRSSGTEEGEVMQSSWAAVLINNTWQLVHPNRVCRAIAGKIPSTLTKSYPLEDRENRENDIKATYIDFYILSNPEHFIYEYFPDEEKWQLLPEPISKEQFFSQERVFHPLWSLGIRMFHEHGRDLTSNSGRATLSFIATNGYDADLIMWYDIRLVTSGEHLDSNQIESLQKLVYMIRSGSLWTCEILLPYTGKYLLDIYAGRLGRPLFRAFEFEIFCTVCHPDPIPLPINPGVIGLGPGPAMHAGGLTNPSLTSGILHVNMSKEYRLKFKMKRACSVKSVLIVSRSIDDSSENSNGELNSIDRQPEYHFKKKQTYVELHVNVFPPKCPGQYLLEISTSTGHGSLKAACYYLLVYDVIYEHENETCALRVARKVLRSATEGGDINEILFRIQDCVCKKIPENDIDIQIARGRVLVLNNIQGRTQKGRKFSIDPRLNATNIVRQVKYESCVNDLIKVLNKLLSYMEDKDQHLNQPQGEEMASCSQLSVDINNEDGVHDVVHMMLCLLGKNEFEEKAVVVLVKEVLTNLKHNGLVVHQKSMERTKKLIEAVKVMSNSKTIKMTYKRVHDVISFMSTIEINSTDFNK